MSDEKKIINFEDKLRKRDKKSSEDKEKGQPRDLLKEFGSFENLPDDEKFDVKDVINMFPDTEKDDQYLVIENDGQYIHFTESEIKAFEIYKNIKHPNKEIFKGSIVYKDVMGTKVVQRYSVHEKIK